MKIHIFYSHYNVSGKGQHKYRPDWFDYEKCFNNLLDTTTNHDVNIHVIMDGKIEDNWISKYKGRYTEHEITTTHDIDSVTKSFYSVINKVDCDESDLIYVLENDYLHVNNWIDKVLELFKSFEGLTYVSLYDHADKYFLPMYDSLVSKIFTTLSHHWRTTPSTCGSYITTKRIFTEDYGTHIGNDIAIGDHYKWLWLNENKHRSILTPIPGLSTHCMEGLLSPAIRWENI